MSYFLTTESLQLDTPSVLEGEEAKHLLLSRRIKVGEKIEVQDSQRARFLCTVEKLSKKSLGFIPIQKLAAPKEYATHITLCQALIAEQALDIIIQKSTELGVHEIIIFTADRSPFTVRPEKIARWEKIATEAAKQCGRTRGAAISLGALPDIVHTKNLLPLLYLSQHATQTITSSSPILTDAKNISLLVGPEGGWSKTEEALFLSCQAAPLLLSPFTLRTETAAIAAVSQLSLFIS